MPTEVLHRVGRPHEEILDAARRVEADLIVIGNKGMTGAKRFFTASVPGRVSEQADRDVLVCRTVVQAVRELEPGQGGIIEQQGEKLAAFMDAEGELHLMSAKCTHLGCTVGVEPRRGDVRLPCHGSRYARCGQVVNGPARARCRPRDRRLASDPGLEDHQVQDRQSPTAADHVDQRVLPTVAGAISSSSSDLRGTPEGRTSQAAVICLK